MSDLRINNITDRLGQHGPDFVGVCTVSSTGAFVVPSGPTEHRGGRGRGVFACGALTPGYSSVMDYVEISSTGNATDFGDASFIGHPCDGGGSSTTRGVWAGAYTPSFTTAIDYTIISSGGGSYDFGELLPERAIARGACTSDGTIAVWGGGNYGSGPDRTNTLQYVTIATMGGAAHFGDLTAASEHVGGCSSPTRGVYILGYGSSTGPASPDTNWINVLDYITFASKGNAIDFGQKTWKGYATGGCASNTRGVFAGGYTPGNTRTNIIEYVTFASLGDSLNFGDLTAAMGELAGTSNCTRGIFGTGTTVTPSTTRVNTIDYITIASTGNAADFGDLTLARSGGAAMGDNSGGIAQ